MHQNSGQWLGFRNSTACIQHHQTIIINHHSNIMASSIALLQYIHAASKQQPTTQFNTAAGLCSKATSVVGF